MSTKAQFFFGMDYWGCSLPLLFFLKQCHLHGINIYNCEIKAGKITFYTSIVQRKKIKSVFNDIKLIHTVGCIGFLCRQLTKPLRILMVLWSCFLFFLLSNTIIDIRYQSTNSSLTNKINSYLIESGYHVPFISVTSDFEEKLKEMIKLEFNTEIAWIEVKRNASIVEISFNDKQYGKTTELSREPLIASKQALVTQFDVKHGEKKVKLNQVVYPGQILVDNVLFDSYNIPQSIYVEGRVWGKTWTTISSELIVSDTGVYLEPMHYLRLLYDCRRQIEKELTEGEYVLSEHILELTQDKTAIKMKVHYTCFEEISKQ